MTAADTRPAVGRRQDYAFFEHITLRYADNDTNGHVNNAHYYAFFDTGVEGYLYHHDLRRSLSEQARTLVVASACRYHQEISFPGAIDVGVRIARIGRSSITFALSVFRNDGSEEAAADGEFVLVCASHDTGRPIAVPDDIRAHWESPC